MQDYYDMIKACSDLKSLFEIWKNKDPKTVSYKVQNEEKQIIIDHKNSRFIPDGIVNPLVWNDNTHKRILYVLKEAYTNDSNGFNLANLLTKAPDIPIWNRIARWTYGIQNTSSDKISKYDHDPAEEIYKECFSQIAVINLKKSNGDSQSIYQEIEAYAEADSEEIKKEFELIDPDIVICGYTFGILMNKVFQISVEKDMNNSGYYIDVCGRERLFIDYYHPGNHYPDLVNYYAVTNIYQQSLLNRKI